jgi:hypothetical protein
MRLEIAAPRKRPETTERLLPIDHVGGRLHLTQILPPPAADRAP